MANSYHMWMYFIHGHWSIHTLSPSLSLPFYRRHVKYQSYARKKLDSAIFFALIFVFTFSLSLSCFIAIRPCQQAFTNIYATITPAFCHSMWTVYAWFDRHLKAFSHSYSVIIKLTNIIISHSSLMHGKCYWLVQRLNTHFLAFHYIV